jgi:hypothetical protein
LAFSVNKHKVYSSLVLNGEENQLRILDYPEEQCVFTRIKR